MKKFLKGQTTLEIGMAIALTIVIVVATISTWSYFNKTMVERMDHFRASRHIAITDDMGQPLDYVPDEFNIFSMADALHPPPNSTEPNDTVWYNWQECFDAFDENMTTVDDLRNESLALMVQAQEVIQESMDMKIDLGKVTVIILTWVGMPPRLVIVMPATRFDQWIYGMFGSQKYYDQSWDEIDHGYDIACGGIPGGSWLVFDGHADIGWPRSHFINPGKDLDDLAEDLMDQSNQKDFESKQTRLEAFIEFIFCIAGADPNVAGPCIEDCRTNYLNPAEEFATQASYACAQGNLGLCEELLNTSLNYTHMYMNCTENCTSY